MSDSIPKIDALTGQNYKDWSNEVLAWLQTKGWDAVVLGEMSKPADTAAAALKEYTSICSKAGGAIYLLISKDQRGPVDNL
ncbi:hypothetical protein OF83DRAFT_1046551, partial [Amylostereum chailletii]